MHWGAPLQFWQAPPSKPHWLSAVPGAHAPAAVQQPWHETESQTQAPPTQRRPAAHSPEVPQRHVPATHASERAGSQAMHAPPELPHAAWLGVVHVLPAQQPFGQLAVPHPVHAPPAHANGVHA
jgi:hypothetical protein